MKEYMVLIWWDKDIYETHFFSTKKKAFAFADTKPHGGSTLVVKNEHWKMNTDAEAGHAYLTTLGLYR